MQGKSRPGGTDSGAEQHRGSWPSGQLRGASHLTRVLARYRVVALMAGCLVMLPGMSSHAQPGSGGCEAALAARDGEPGLPPGLLRAIARVESGGHPFAFNVGGASFFAGSQAEAVTRVSEHLARGNRSIDVGCMQINLLHHPGAFASLHDAFDPVRNVAYAVRLLRELHARHGDWPSAVSRYHSAEPARREGYWRRVSAALEQRDLPLASSMRSGGDMAMDRVVIRMSPAAMQVQVIRPTRSVTSRPPRI